MSEQRPKNILFIMLVVVNTIFVIFLYSNQSDLNELTLKKTTQETSKKIVQTDSKFRPKEGHTFEQFTFGSFSTNLAKVNGPQRYLKLDIILYVETKIDERLLEIQNKTPILRDEIISYLNTVEPDTITKKEGLEILKSKIKGHINQNLKSDHVKRVLFTKYGVN